MFVVKQTCVEGQEALYQGMTNALLYSAVQVLKVVEWQENDMGSRLEQLDKHVGTRVTLSLQIGVRFDVCLHKNELLVLVLCFVDESGLGADSAARDKQQEFLSRMLLEFQSEPHLQK